MYKMEKRFLSVLSGLQQPLTQYDSKSNTHLNDNITLRTARYDCQLEGQLWTVKL